MFTQLSGPLHQHLSVSNNSCFTGPCARINLHYRVTVTHPLSICCLALPQVPVSMMDMNVLMACELLLDQVFTEGNSSLLQQLYHHLLFDFRIWTRSHFAVCLGKAKVGLAMHFCSALFFSLPLFVVPCWELEVYLGLKLHCIYVNECSPLVQHFKWVWHL